MKPTGKEECGLERKKYYTTVFKQKTKKKQT